MTPVEIPELLTVHWILLAVVGAISASFGALITYISVQAQIARLREDNARLSTLIEAEKELHEEKLNAYDEAQDQLTFAFGNLANRALTNNNESFLHLARESLQQFHMLAREDLSQREQSIEHLVHPLKEALDKSEQQIRLLEQERKQAYGSLSQYLESMTQTQQQLQAETRNLVQSLRRPEVRGRWGELTLRRLVELAGMSPHCDFTEQVLVRTDAGALRPDMLIHLPDEREIVVDVKTPLDAYLSAIEAEDDGARDAALVRHARNVRDRIRELSTKAYWSQFDKSPDFVVLFIPGEQFLSAALDTDRTLLEDAISQKIIVATPMSLIAILRAIAFSWRQLAIIRNADKIRDIGEDFYTRLGAFTEHLSKLGRNLATSVEHFNHTVGSLEHQLLPSARKFVEMGINSKKALADIELIERRVREPVAATSNPDADATR